ARRAAAPAVARPAFAVVGRGVHADHRAGEGRGDPEPGGCPRDDSGAALPPDAVLAPALERLADRPQVVLGAVRHRRLAFVLVGVPPAGPGAREAGFLPRRVLVLMDPRRADRALLFLHAAAGL